jgi:uncharacterized protein (UPF0261 family)
MINPVYVIGTFDTKGDELRFAVQCVEDAGSKAVTVDVSTSGKLAQTDFSAEEVATCHPSGIKAVLGSGDRGASVAAMAEALTCFMLKRPDIGAVLGLGGSGNTAIVTTAMRALPIGLPKIMVSTLASGDVAPFVGASDIMMLHAVADIAGLNELTRTVIGNAAHAAAGMALHPVVPGVTARPALGMTMFGVTTPAVTQIRKHLESEFDCFVFHATGTGGQSFEKLADSGFLSAAIDITTTEVADFLFGGVLPCTSDRFGAFIRTGLPYVVSTGALDMINFGPLDTVPAQFKDRTHYVHNPFVTLIRTNAEENKLMGKWIVDRINQMEGATRLLLPLRGVSALDAAGMPFCDPDADGALFDAIRENWNSASNRRLIEVDAHINDAVFADAAVAALRDAITERSDAAI